MNIKRNVIIDIWSSFNTFAISRLYNHCIHILSALDLLIKIMAYIPKPTCILSDIFEGNRFLGFGVYDHNEMAFPISQ